MRFLRKNLTTRSTRALSEPVEDCLVVPARTPDTASADRGSAADEPLARLLRPAGRADRVTHVERLPARSARSVDWPDWLPDLVITRLQGAGIEQPWSHQVAAADTA